MSKIYNILLNNDRIGTTELENADAPMGVVFGRISFLDPVIIPGYYFFKDYCSIKGIHFEDHLEDKIISTMDIPDLKVQDASGNHIKGLATSISGMDSDYFEIYISGISYPFYQEEFPHHVKAYEERLK